MQVQTKLREHGLALCRLRAVLGCSPGICINDPARKKEVIMKEIYDILTVGVGVPPLLDRLFANQ